MTKQTQPSKAPPKTETESRDLLALEEEAFQLGFSRVAGVDEAGRGPLAGPVVAAACVIAPGLLFPGINDSKLLTPQKREHFFEVLSSHSEVLSGIGIVDEKEIDEGNILEATKQAMRLAVRALRTQPDYLLIDGPHGIGSDHPHSCVIQGDRRSQSIAAASILAKVTRDRIMLRYHTLYPEYGFDRHKGYGTAAHMKALQQYGPSPIHRLSFAPVKSYSHLLKSN